MTYFSKQLEPKEPSHRALASLSNSSERLVHLYSLVSAYSEWCAVHETDSRAFPQQNFLYEYNQGYSNLTLQFYEPVIRYDVREQMAHVLAYLVEIVVLEAPVSR